MLGVSSQRGSLLLGDPAGLLGRITELGPLCEDQRIRQAVESGDPFRVYRALVWARLFKRLPEHRETLDMLVRARRLFARPVKGALFLGTVNGFGATLLGNTDAEPDGTFIALHCLVALFRLPVFPLGGYLVQNLGGGPLRSSWRVYARVPMTLLQWLWSRALAVGVVVAVAVGGYQAFYASRHHDVTVVNALSRPMHVSAGALQRTVPPGSHLTVNLPVGKQAFRALAEDGSEVDAISAEVKSGSDALVWNIAGAAPVYSEAIIYSSKDASSSASEGQPPALFCGQHWVDVPDVDIAFTTPPREVSMPKGQAHLSKLMVNVPPLSAEKQVSLCFNILADQGRLAEAIAFLETSARLNGWKGSDAYNAAYLAMLDNPAQGLALARRLRDADPTNVDANRLYQTAAAQAGVEKEVIEEYRARAAAEPDSPMAQYLALRVDDAEAFAKAEQLLARFPNDSNALRLAVLTRAARSDWAGTLSAWHALADAKAADADVVVDSAVTALVAQGHRGEALTVLENTFEHGEARARFEAAQLFAQVALLEGQGDADRLVKKLAKNAPLAVVRLQAGLPDDGKDVTPTAVFLRAVAVDGALARETGAKLKVTDASRLDAGSWALAYGEAIRVGDQKTADSLARAPLLSGQRRELFNRYVRGEAASLDQLLLPLEIRAAAAFIRSRDASLEARERNELMAQAKRDDWLHSSVSRAMAGWTRSSTAH
jgi:hypothetical protein